MDTHPRAMNPLKIHPSIHLLFVAVDTCAVTAREKTRKELAAYGQPCHKALRERGPALARLLITEAGIVPHVLRLAKNGTPWHPLYLSESLKPVLWQL